MAPLFLSSRGKKKAPLIYVHIGMPKTGSSAIQAFLALNYETLKKRGVLYPNPPEFEIPFQTTSGNAAGLIGLFFKNDLEKVHKYIKSFFGYKILILSSEDLFEVITQYPDRFFSVFNEYNYKIICYVRRQDNFFSSFYNELVKTKDVTNNSIMLEMVKKYNLCNILLNCLKYTDSEKFIVRPYEKQQLYCGDIFSDFLNCIGLEMNNDYVFPDEIVNPSFNREALEFRRILNELGIDRYNYNNKFMINGLLGQYTVANNMGRPFQEQNIYSPEERIKIIKSFEEGNKQIAKIFLKREDGRLFFDPLPDANEKWQPPKPLTVEKVLSICEYILKVRFKDKFEEVLIKGIIKGTIERFLQKSEELDDESFIQGSLIYALESKPFQFSKDVANIEKKEDFWYIESSGGDPHFLIPEFNINNNGNLVVKVEITTSINTLLQLFYITDNEEFDERHSVRKSIYRGYNKIYLTINDDRPIRAMRLDPGAAKGIYLLHAFEVREQG